MSKDKAAHDRILNLVDIALQQQEQGLLTEKMLRQINEEIQALSQTLRANTHSLFIAGLSIGMPVDTSRWDGRTDLDREQDLRLDPEPRRLYNYLRERKELCLMSEIARDLYGSSLTEPIKEKIQKACRAFQSLGIASEWPRDIEMQSVRVGSNGRELAFILHMRAYQGRPLRTNLLPPYRGPNLPEYRSPDWMKRPPSS